MVRRRRIETRRRWVDLGRQRHACGRAQRGGGHVHELWDDAMRCDVRAGR